MDLKFEKIEKSDSESLASWLSSDTWPNFIGKAQSKDDVLNRIKDGAFFGDGEENFWIKNTIGECIGLIELYELNELAPMFSIRFKTEYRGLGLGKPALEWLTSYVFRTYPDKRRIEGQTREDNIAMRKLFNKCGYAKEAYYRFAYPTDDGGRLASVAYGILREDWLSGQITPIPWEHDSFFGGDRI